MTAPVRFHLSHTGPLAGVRICGAGRDAFPAFHAGYHGLMEPERICPECLAIWNAIGDDDGNDCPDRCPQLGCGWPGIDRDGDAWRCRACGHRFTGRS